MGVHSIMQISSQIAKLSMVASALFFFWERGEKGGGGGVNSFIELLKGTRLCSTLDNGGTWTKMFFFCARGKVWGDNNRLLRDESIESCVTEQSCSVDLPCVTFCFVLLLLDL